MFDLSKAENLSIPLIHAPYWNFVMQSAYCVNIWLQVCAANISFLLLHRWLKSRLCVVV